MATWSSGRDVLADLDELSEFSAGCNYTKDIPIVAYSSYGRGTFIQEREASPPPSPLFTLDEDSFWAAPRKFEAGIGRGDKIKALTRRWHDEESLQQQLRMAMGAGYSNELIENHWNGDSSSEHSSELGQYEDVDILCETPSTESATTTQSSPLNESPTTIESSSPSFSELQDAIESPTKEVQKKAPRKNRNALLNSLLKLNKIDNGVSIVEKNVEIVKKNLVPEKKDSRTTLLYVPPPMRVKISEIPPEQVQSSRKSLLYVPPPMRVKASENKANTELKNVILENLDGSRKKEVKEQTSYAYDIFKKTDFGFNFSVQDFPPL